MSWNHLRDTERTARKTHRCCLCGLMIAAGEKYVERIGTSYGDIVSMKMHKICEEKTKSWDEMDWECGHDEAEFRKNELGL